MYRGFIRGMPQHYRAQSSYSLSSMRQHHWRLPQSRNRKVLRDLTSRAASVKELSLALLDDYQHGFWRPSAPAVEAFHLGPNSNFGHRYNYICSSKVLCMNVSEC